MAREFTYWPKGDVRTTNKTRLMEEKAQSEKPLESKLFVGNLAWSITSEELGEAFAEIGEVLSASVITDRQTGRSRGFGFVEMATHELAEKAVKEMNGKELSGRAIVVNIARPKTDRDESDRGSHNFDN